MKFQYIRAAVRPAGKRYFFPACVTRYYYRRNFYLDSLPERAEITVDYPFAFEVYCNGVRCACEAGQSALLSGLSKGLNRLAVKTYLSNDPMRFTPALSVSLSRRGEMPHPARRGVAGLYFCRLSILRRRTRTGSSRTTRTTTILHPA